jgi:hypothetical protein
MSPATAIVVSDQCCPSVDLRCPYRCIALIRREIPFAVARGEVPFLLAQVHRSGSQIVFALELFELSSRGLVFRPGRLLCEEEGHLSLRPCGIREFRSQTLDCRRITGLEGGLILPEPL